MRYAVLLAACWIFSAQSQVPVPCKPRDKACAVEVAKKHPAKQLAFWEATMKRPVEERIGPAPKELIDFLALDNLANGYPNKPRAAQLPDRFIADFKRIYSELPEAVRRKVEPKLAGIYFADDIGGTGFSDSINDPTGKRALGFIVLDPSVLAKRSANEWATWKDNTPFSPDPKWSLTEQIEPPERNTPPYAMQYILLHELAHVLSVGAAIHPSWNLDPRKITSTRDFDFFNLSWHIANGAYSPLPGSDFPQRKHVAFYFGAKLKGSQMLETYTSLGKTTFPSLYAATHPGDDFAESFANYVHVVMMGKPFEISIANSGRVVHTYRACWDEPRCKSKRALIEAMLRGR
ncbi:MAG: hypothetical protein ABIQ72_06960 [Usitatibacter sp.]